ncbi:MAG: hypothetical protein AB7F22_29850 [Reyranella sp.]|uniref:hypothetical protein n=1 Tax=Reyranella sp. TaxID=1929291 RepID=UPI003D115044
MATIRRKVRRSPARRSGGPLGRYAFRFSGFTRVASDARDRNGVPYHIVGVGHVVFQQNGAIIGRQSSTVIAISGAGPTLQRTVFALTGSYLTRADQTGALTAFFHRVRNPDTPREAIADQPEMSDVFEFISFDRGARLSLVSTAPTLLPANELVDELVSVEAFRQ